jgi:hypothetical protein
MVNSFGNFDKVTWHEASHSLDLYFKITQSVEWMALYEEIKTKVPNFFLFIAESNFLPTAGGHPHDNAAELFASVISSLTHPDIVRGLQDRAGLKPDRHYVGQYLKTLRVLIQVLADRVGAKAPIVDNVRKVAEQVEKMLL